MMESALRSAARRLPIQTTRPAGRHELLLHRSRGQMNETEPLANDANTEVFVAEHVTWNDVDTDLVVFNQQDGTYHAFDRVGSDVWRAIAHHGRLGAVVAELRQRYVDDTEAIAEDIGGFVDHAARLGLLVLGRR